MNTILVKELNADLPAMISLKPGRVESIDLLRGTVMIIMALDHVRGYFHYDAFMYSPTDLSQTNVALFFTRWITHFCAPVFIFLAGTSAYLYGVKRSKKELSFFLLKRGIWLVLAEVFIVGLFRTFNPSYTYLNLQVIFVIGISMIVLSVIIYMNRWLILLTGALLIGAHNLLDSVHIEGNSFSAFFWSILHDENHFTFGRFNVYVRYPVIPWLGVMTLGYYLGRFYASGYEPIKRRKNLLILGIASITLFIILRSGNWYGDAAHWSIQKNPIFSMLSFLNVTKYPPSLLYILITLGPSLIFLAFTEKKLNAWATQIVIFGRVPMFYYLAHILLIHILAAVAALSTGYPEMIVLNNPLNTITALRGYGFNLLTVHLLWIMHILILYPFCKWFDRYKRSHQSEYWGLSYM
jgi:uncharacterized membrane protein